MKFIILLINIVATGFALGAMVHAAYLARISPLPRLRNAWWGMLVLLGLALAFGTFTTVDRYLLDDTGAIALGATLTALLGSGFIFASVLLARLTADDVLKIAELKEAAYTDKLTALPNRRRFDSHFAEQIEIARRRNQPLALVMADIDHFKLVNDTYGHEWGDLTLKHLGTLLQTHKRTSDAVFRVGGEEFAFVVANSRLEQSRALAERMRTMIESTPLTKGERRTFITVSFGVAMLRPDDDIATLYERTDKALYRAKRLGRNRVCVEEPVEIAGATPDESSQST